MPSVSGGFPSGTGQAGMECVHGLHRCLLTHVFSLLILEFQFAKTESNLCLHVLVNAKFHLHHWWTSWVNKSVFLPFLLCWHWSWHKVTGRKPLKLKERGSRGSCVYFIRSRNNLDTSHLYQEQYYRVASITRDYWQRPLVCSPAAQTWNKHTEAVLFEILFGQ